MKKILALVLTLVMIFGIAPLKSDAGAITAYATSKLDDTTLNKVLNYHLQANDLIKKTSDYFEKARKAWQYGSDFIGYAKLGVQSFVSLKDTLNKEYDSFKDFTELSYCKSCIKNVLSVYNSVSIPSNIERSNWVKVMGDIDNAIIAGDKYFSNATIELNNISKNGYSSTCTVTLNANGGSVSPSSLSTVSGGTVTLPTPTRNGYKCLGWTASKTASKADYKCGGTYKVTADITLYAIWETNSGTTPGTDPIPTPGTKTDFDISKTIADIWNSIDKFVVSAINSAAEAFGDSDSTKFVTLWDSFDNLFRIIISFGIELINTVISSIPHS